MPCGEENLFIEAKVPAEGFKIIFRDFIDDGFSLEVELELEIPFSDKIDDVETVIVESGDDVCGAGRGGDLELVVDVVLVEEIAESGFEWFVEVGDGEGLVEVADVPGLEAHVVASDQKFSIGGEFDG